MLTVMNQDREEQHLEHLSDEQLRWLNARACEILKYRSRSKCASAAAQFSIGDDVIFKHTRTGVTHQGKVVSVGPKNIKLREFGTGTLWTVTSTLLKHQEF